jgi:hypothetical protein
MKSPLGATLTLPTTRAAFILAGLLGIALCQVRLLGIWGVESALVLGIALPPLAAAIGARAVVICRRNGYAVTATRLLCTAASVSSLVLVIPVLMLAMNAFRVKNCAPLEGLFFILLGPGFGVLFATLTGLVVSAAMPWPRIATITAIAIPVGALAVSAYSLYATPALFAYGHFFGFYGGTLYDEEMSIPVPLLILRVATVSWAAGFGLLWVGLYNPERIRLLLSTKLPRLVCALLGAAVCLVTGLTFFFHGEQLGLSTSRGNLEKALGGRIEGRKCTIIFPRELDPREAGRLGQECDFRVEQMEGWLGVRQKTRITAFFFRSPESKRDLMGAAQTNVAKPWRDEIYLLLTPWPHPAIAHEIAHVVAKNAARGPLGLSASMGGLWLNPTLIEGLAVAAAWNVSDGMTPHQWARAMVETGLAPPLQQVIGASFLRQPKQQAYTLAGSLIRYIGDKYGSGALRRIYASGDIASALDVPFEKLLGQWRAEISRIPLPDGARERARGLFSGKSIFSEICPHQVAILRAQLHEELGANNSNGAVAACRAILKVNPNDDAVRTALISALAKGDRLQAAHLELDRLIQSGRTPAPFIVRARAALGDAAWRTGRAEDALGIYRSLLTEPLSEDARRTVEVKIGALSAGGEQSALLRELLVDPEGKETDGALAVYLARELRNYRRDGLPRYLEARQLFFARHYAQAANLLSEARQMGLSTERLAREATRLEAVARFATKEYAQSEKLWRSLNPRDAIALEASDWLARIAHARNR